MCRIANLDDNEISSTERIGLIDIQHGHRLTDEMPEETTGWRSVSPTKLAPIARS